MGSEPGEVTQLLIELRAGKRDAEEKLIPLVYAELRVLSAKMRGAVRDGVVQKQ